MSVLDFPTSPTNGQYYNGFVLNAANETWDSAFAPRPATIPISTPNVIINGAFDINQRNFTSTTTSGSFGFDRWLMVGSATTTYSAQTFTPGSAPADGREGTNFARIATTGQTGVGTISLLSQRIEDVRTLAGQTATVSFWAKAASGTPKVAVELDRFFGTGGSANDLTYAGQVTLSTSWVRYSVTANVPSVSGKTIGSGSFVGLNIWVSAGSNNDSRTGSIGIQSNTFDFWGVQLEAGAAATEFRRNAPSIQGELAGCQRYYWRTDMALGGPGTLMDTGWSYAPNGALLYVNNPVPMRTKPSSFDWTGNAANYKLRTGQTPALALDSGWSSNLISSLAATGITGLSTGEYQFLRVESTGAYVGFSAEL